MSTEPKAFKNGVQFAWDSTSIKLAEECLRKYYYKMICGWQAKVTSPHLRFGGVYATAIEHYYKYTALGMDHDEALIEITREALVATWDQGAPWESGHNLKTRPNLIRTIIWYIEHFKDDPARPIMLASGKPAVELSFTLPVDNGIVLSGHLDRLTEYAGHIMGLDNKTTGSTISPRYFRAYDTDIQMSLYTFAGRVIYGLPVKGMLIDAAQIAVGFTRFERGITMRTEAQLQEFYETAMETIERARRATEEKHFPMNRTACGNYGGCEFHAVCSRSPEVRETWLKADFIQGERWDPLKAR